MCLNNQAGILPINDLYGIRSGQVTNGTFSSQPAAPSEPTGVKLVANSTSQLTLTWSAPLEPNGIVASYTVFKRTQPNAEWQEVTTTPDSRVMSATMDGFKPHTRVYAAVKARTAPSYYTQGGGLGKMSAIQQATTLEAGKPNF